MDSPKSNNGTATLLHDSSTRDKGKAGIMVVPIAAASAYLILSLPFSIVCIVRPRPMFQHPGSSSSSILDTVMGVLTTAAASSAASIVYLAHNGNANTNWVAICQQFGDFCQQVSLAVVGSSSQLSLLASPLYLSLPTTTY